MRFCFFIMLLLCCNTASLQENSSQISAVSSPVAELSAADLLQRAKSLRSSERQTSIELAQQALLLAQVSNDQEISAQIHRLLGDLTQQAKQIEQSKQHFLQASVLYQRINDLQNQIRCSLDYAALFLAEKRYVEWEKIVVQLLASAQENNQPWPIAQVLSAQGDGYFKAKRYNDAIATYTDAINYLSDDQRTIRKSRGVIYKKLAESYKRLKNREETAAYYKKALAVFTALGDQKNMARTLNTLAEAQRYLGDYVTALDYSLQGLEIHKQIDDPEGRAKALNGAGIIYRHIGRYEKALQHAYQAHLYYKKIDDLSGIAKTSNQMGLIYTRLKQFEQARSFYQLTIDLPSNQIEPKTRASALREMGVIELDSGNYAAAMVMVRKAHQIYQSQNNKTNESLTARIIGNVYRAQNDDSNAIAYYRESLAIASEVGSLIYQVKAQLPLGAILIGKNTNEAISLLKSALQLSTQIKNKPYQLYAYRDLHQAEKVRGNIAQSLAYAEQQIALAAAIQQEREDNDLVRAKATLHSHKIEMELESLKEKAKLDQLELAKKSNEIEIAEQARIISELELTKNQYASVALASLLAISFVVVIFIYRGFVHSRQRNKELNYLAARDPLTNCYNRRILFDFLDRDFSDFELLDEYCIIMLDIDHFKQVNDTYGHIAGDQVLCGVANVLQDCIRKSDFAARYGGEEFCLVLSGASQRKAVEIAETIREKVENSVFNGISITCSFGVTSIKFNARTPSELIHQADLALYQSKANGRNQVTLWSQALID